MSKINPTIKTTKVDVNNRLAGGAGMYAAKQTNVESLRRLVMANLLWENQFYVDGKESSDEISRLIPLCPPEDVYNIAKEARLVQKLRHTPLFIAVEMCKYDGTKPYVSKLLPEIITRADMLTDFLSLYWKQNGSVYGKKTPIANCAKKGLAEAFHNFNEYKFAKYDRNTSVKLRDVMFLCHPKARNEYEAELFKKVANRTLSTPDTWEVALSTGQDKRETWIRLIEEGKLGGMAMLRNIRNMAKSEVPDDIIKLGISKLNGTMLLPLDFVKAWNINPSYEKDIENAMIATYANLPKLKGRTLFIVDVSGSMNAKISFDSTFSRVDVASAMAMLAANQCENFELVLTAGNDGFRKGKHLHVTNVEKGFGIINTIKNEMSKLGGGGIFTRQCLEWCKENIEGEFDRIIIFSDSQDCDYHTKRIPKPFGKRNYIVDVSAYKHGINYKGIWDAEVSGWSEHFLTYIAAYEGIENTFVEE